MIKKTISICRIKQKNGNKITMLVIDKVNHETVGFRAVKYKQGLKNCIVIKKNEHLKFDTAILYNQMYRINNKCIQYKITDVDNKYISNIMKMYNKCNKYNRDKQIKNDLPLINDLHKELHKIKRKIEICKFNNEDYSKLEARLNEIVNELGCSYDNKRHNYKPFNGHRVAVNEGYIKIYGIN